MFKMYYIKKEPLVKFDIVSFLRNEFMTPVVKFGLNVKCAFPKLLVAVYVFYFIQLTTWFRKYNVFLTVLSGIEKNGQFSSISYVRF